MFEDATPPAPAKKKSHRKIWIALILAVVVIAIGEHSNNDSSGDSGSSATYMDEATLSTSVEQSYQDKVTDGSTVSANCIHENAHYFECQVTVGSYPAAEHKVLVSSDGNSWQTIN